MNIYEKINAIMSDVRSLKKDGRVEYGNTKYNFLSEAKTTDTFREHLIKHKLILLPIDVDETVEQLLNAGKQNFLTHGKYTYRLINVEDPGEYIDIKSTGQGYDSADKGSGKASSTAYKYLLWRSFAVPSNDDPDNISSAELVDTPTDEEIKKRKEEWEAAESALLDAAKELGFLPKDVNEKFEKKYGVKYYDATVAQLNKAKKDMYAKKQQK